MIIPKPGQSLLRSGAGNRTVLPFARAKGGGVKQPRALGERDFHTRQRRDARGRVAMAAQVLDLEAREEEFLQRALDDPDGDPSTLGDRVLGGFDTRAQELFGDLADRAERATAFLKLGPARRRLEQRALVLQQDAEDSAVADAIFRPAHTILTSPDRDTARTGALLDRLADVIETSALPRDRKDQVAAAITARAMAEGRDAALSPRFARFKEPARLLLENDEPEAEPAGVDAPEADRRVAQREEDIPAFTLALTPTADVPDAPDALPSRTDGQAGRSRVDRAADVASQLLSGGNVGLAEGAGLPVDLITLGLNLLSRGVKTATGLDIGEIERPFLGSQQIQELLNAAGTIAPPSDDSAGQFARRTGRSIGAALLPGAGVVGTSANVTRQLGSQAIPLMQQAARSPAKFLGAELGVGAAGGAGAAAANQIAPDSVAADVAGELLGAVAGTGAAVTAARLLRQTPRLNRPRQSAGATGAGVSRRDPQLDDFRAKLDNGVPVDELLEHPAVRDALDQMQRMPATKDAPGFGSPEWWRRRRFNFDGEQVVGRAEADKRLHKRAYALGWTDDGLKFPAGAIKFEKKAYILLGAPGAGKSSVANPLARAKGAAIVDSDDAKKVLPEFAGGIGTSAVHAESDDLARGILERISDDGANVVIPRVGGAPGLIQDQIGELVNKGYRVFVINVSVPASEAFRRMLRRFATTGRLIDPSYARRVGDRPKRTFDTFKQDGGLAGFAEIDNSGPLGAPKTIIEDKTGILTGVEF